MKKIHQIFDHRSYFFAVTISVTAVFLQLLLKNLVSHYAFIFLYPSIVISAYMLGIRPTILTLLLNSFAYFYFYTELLTSGKLTLQEGLLYSIYFISALAITFLIGRSKNIHEYSEKALQSEGRLQRATEATGVGVWEVDIRSKKLERTPTHDQVYGLEFDPSHDFEFFLARYHPDDREKVRESIQKIIDEKEQITIESRIVWPDGSIHWAELSGKRMDDKILGTIIDITERKGTEDLLKSIVTYSPMPVVVTDVHGIVKIWNPAAQALFGWHETEIIGKEIPFIPHEGLDRKKDNMRILVGGKKVVNFETRRKKKDGSYVEVMASASPLPGGNDVVIVYADLTNLRRAQNLLQEVINKSPYIIFIKDREGKYILFNNRLTELFGNKNINILGKTDYEIFPEEAARDYTINDFEVWKYNKPMVVEEKGVLNGEDKTFMSTKFPLIDDEGRPYAIGGISVDITERKKMENDLRFAVEARDRFLNIASHELKTPLTSMKLQLQVYRRQLQKGNRELLDESRLMKLVADTLRQTSTLERLVNDMLDISRINTGKLHYEFQETDLCRLIEDVSESLRPGIEANGGELTLDICEHIHGNWDRQRIEQVIVNLITNASKYGKGKPIHVRTFQSGEFGIIEVIDEGMGVAPEDQKRIFEQFERAVNQNEVSGFGLGLYISRKIVEAHQGLITVQSIKGQGSTFTVALPTHLHTKHEGHISL